MKKVLTFLTLVAGSIISVSAQTVAPAGRINDSAIIALIKSASNIVGMLVPFAVSLAVLAFFWFLIGFIWKAKDDPKKQAESKMGMLYSVLAIFVMVSIWGIIGLIGNISGIGQGGGAPIPTVPVLQ